jgi:hypothetical protein
MEACPRFDAYLKEKKKRKRKKKKNPSQVENTFWADFSHTVQLFGSYWPFEQTPISNSNPSPQPFESIF